MTIIKPIVVGNVAKYFGKKREEDGHTHQWTVYLKAFENEDYSTFIKKVQFKLHDSYANPTRIVTRPPYEVTETGWGSLRLISGFILMILRKGLSVLIFIKSELF